MSDIEKDIKNIEQYINLMLDKGYCDCNELNVISTGKYCDGSKNVAYSMQNILAERKQDKQKIKELEEENKKLKIVSAENTYGNENTYFITKRDLARIDTNKYLIEIKEGKFVDAKQLYLDSLNSIPKQEVKDVIRNETINISGFECIAVEDLIELTEDK